MLGDKNNISVLHILWSGGIGGKERAVFQLVRAQMNLSMIRPAVAFGQATGYYFEEFRKLDCDIVDLGMRRGMDFARILSMISQMKPYSIHHFHSAEIPIMMASALCRGASRIYSHRGGMPAASLYKSLGYFIVGLILRASFHCFTGNTKHAANIGALLTRIPVYRWVVAYNGMDFSLLMPKQPGDLLRTRHGINPSDKLVIGTSANLRKWKRTELLIKACSELPKDSFRLLIVGDGPDRERLEKITHEFGLQDNTIFTGSQKHIGDYLAIMDVFVLPSGSQESFGNSAIEAMAVGLPTIVFHDGGGLVEHIQNADTGFIVDSVDDLTKTLKILIDNETLRKQVGINGSHYVKRTYTLESMAQRYDSIYHNVLMYQSP